MPFVSQAQRRKFFAMEREGNLPKGTAAKWNAETPKGKKLPEHVKKAAWNSSAAIDSVGNRADSLYNSLSKNKFIANKMDSTATSLGFSGGREAIRNASLTNHYMKNVPRTNMSKPQSDSVDVAIKDMGKGESKLWDLANSKNPVSRTFNAVDVAQHTARRSGFVKATGDMLNRANPEAYNQNVSVPAAKGAPVRVAAAPAQKPPPPPPPPVPAIAPKQTSQAPAAVPRKTKV